VGKKQSFAKLMILLIHQHQQNGIVLIVELRVRNPIQKVSSVDPAGV